MKIAKVIFVYKEEDPCHFANYRPISLLSNMTEFFERVIYNRLICFSEKKNNTPLLLHLFTLLEKISSAIDRHETTARVFLDLSKTFNTIDNKILFGKLEHYGVRGLAFEWIKSCFSCRKQSVEFNSTCSSKQFLNMVSRKVPFRSTIFHIIY